MGERDENAYSRFVALWVAAGMAVSVPAPYPIKRLEAIRNQWPSSDVNHPDVFPTF